MKSIRTLRILPILVCSVLIGLPAFGAWFSLTEFPNLFLPAEWRGKPAHQVPAEVVTESRNQVEKAIASVFRRLTVPIRGADGKIRQVRYFPYLQAELSKLDPSARLYASGGVVRSAISYLYASILEGTERIPPEPPEKVLERIIGDTRDLGSLKVRGVGSDFDVLLASRGQKPLDELIRIVLDATNSAETAHGQNVEKGAAKRSLFTIGDAKDYNKQILRSTNQGGADIDFLAFDAVTGKFVEPPGHNGIVNNLIRGFYRYLAPMGKEFIENGPKQIVRGGRALLELPFISLEDPTVLLNELEDLERNLERSSVDKQTIGSMEEQFNKMVRNARFAGANNRFYRSQPNSVEARFLRIAKSLGKKLGRNLLPEFVERTPLNKKAEVPESLRLAMLDYKEFVTRYTNNGELYHGTPSIENGLAIIRQGLFLSSSEQGTAVFGRGAYTSPDRAISEGYAGTDGIVFRLTVKNDPNLRILDWTKVDPAWIAILKAKRVDPIEFVAENYSIDIVVNQHVLIQNSEAIQISRSVLSDIAATSLSKAAKGDLKYGVRTQHLQRYLELELYLLSLNVDTKANRRQVTEISNKVIGEQAKTLREGRGVTVGEYLSLTTALSEANHEFDASEMQAASLEVARSLNLKLQKSEAPSVFDWKTYIQVYSVVAATERSQIITPEEFQQKMVLTLERDFENSKSASAAISTLESLSTIGGLKKEKLIQLLQRFGHSADGDHVLPAVVKLGRTHPDVMDKVWEHIDHVRRTGKMGSLSWLMQHDVLPAVIQDIVARPTTDVKANVRQTFVVAAVGLDNTYYYARPLENRSYKLDRNEYLLAQFDSAILLSESQDRLKTYMRKFALSLEVSEDLTLAENEQFVNLLWKRIETAVGTNASIRLTLGPVLQILVGSSLLANSKIRSTIRSIVADVKAEARESLNEEAKWVLRAIDSLDHPGNIAELYEFLFNSRVMLAGPLDSWLLLELHDRLTPLDLDALFKLASDSPTVSAFIVQFRSMFDYVYKGAGFSRRKHEFLKKLENFAEARDRLGPQVEDSFKYAFRAETAVHDPEWTDNLLKKYSQKPGGDFGRVIDVILRAMRDGKLTPAQAALVQKFEIPMIRWALEKVSWNSSYFNGERDIRGQGEAVLRSAFFILNFLTPTDVLQKVVGKQTAYFPSILMPFYLSIAAGDPIIQKHLQELENRKDKSDLESTIVAAIRAHLKGEPIPKLTQMPSNPREKAKYDVTNLLLEMVDRTRMDESREKVDLYRRLVQVGQKQIEVARVKINEKTVFKASDASKVHNRGKLHCQDLF